jgi:hypothetical protein
MRFVFTILFPLVILCCSNAATTNNAEQNFLADTNSMLNPIPKELLVLSIVNDSDVVFINKRCVVHSVYSENELMEIKKNFNSENEWEAFYDNYLFYNDDVSMYICERSMVITENRKKYIQFVLASGDKITVDRIKSVGKLFFFNPETGVKQCDSFNFDSRKYKEF